MKPIVALLAAVSFAALLTLALRSTERPGTRTQSSILAPPEDVEDPQTSVATVATERRRSEAAARDVGEIDPGSERLGTAESQEIEARPVQIEVQSRIRSAAGGLAPTVGVVVYVESATGVVERVGSLETIAGQRTKHELLLADGEALAKGRAHLLGEVRADGFQSRRERARAPRDAGPFQLRLSLGSGWTVLGQVVDEADVPVPAQVQLRAAMNADGTRASNPAFVEARGGGRFAVHCAGDVDGVLDVDAGARGSAYEPVALRANERERELRPVVRGAGVITVVADEGGGAPAVGLRLGVRAAELRRDGLGDPAREKALRLAGGGHLEVEATTDANGIARFAGLRAGLDYDVLATTRLEDRRTSTAPIGVARASAQGTRVEVRLRRPHLRVTAVGEDGEPVAAKLQIADAGEIGDPVQARGRAERATSLASGGESEIHVFEVSDGRQYLVHNEGTLEEGPVLVTVPSGSGGQDIEVRVAAPPLRAVLLVRSDADVLDWYSVRLEDVESGWPVAEESGDGKVEEIVRARLGTYRLVVLARDFRRGRRERPFLRGETMLEVKEQGLHEIDVELTRGGWLEVELAGRVDSELALDAESRSAWGSLDSTIDVDAATGVALSLWRAGRYFGTVERTHRVERGMMARFGPDTATIHPLATTVVSDGLPSGTFALVATVGDGRRWSQTVTIAPGETTKVRLTLD